MNQEKEKLPIIDLETPILPIRCSDEFYQLSSQEQFYSYYFYKAGWEGAKICYFQRSFESPALFCLITLIFREPIQSIREKCLSKGLVESDLQKILVYVASVLINCGNYKSFGDTKFIPEVNIEIFETFLHSTTSYETHKALIDELWSSIAVYVYSYEGEYKKIGFPGEDGFSGYYSKKITKSEIGDLSEFFQIMNLSELNTRVIKTSDKDFSVLIASVNYNKPETHVFKEKKIKLVYGDFSAFLRRLTNNLIKALSYASNLNQKNMLKSYIDHFLTGSMDKHKDSQRYWVKDVGPIVETNIGFIETYLDPLQHRAEFEGFVAVVNKKLSERVQKLVDIAEHLLLQSPWPKDFEKDRFLKPDFTSLSILSFSSSGVPLGINIPNYDDIRQEEGFKNVYLANCLPKLKKVNYLSDSDADLILKYWEINSLQKVTFHELLGHGCGKLFQETEDGFNFDIETVKNPLTGGKITSWYKANETWSQKFGPLSNPYEECRADSVALYFCTIKEACEILTPEHMSEFDDFRYSSWLGFVHSGVSSLEYYVPDAKKWGQAHCKGRFVILRVLIEAGQGFVEVQKVKKNEKDWIDIKVDRTKILSVGFKALKEFLLKMMVYKSTADLESASKMFEDYANVNDNFLEIRSIIVENKQPRRLELQGHLEINGEKIVYKEFQESFEGIINSYMNRYPCFDQEVYDLWKEYKEYYI